MERKLIRSYLGTADELESPVISSVDGYSDGSLKVSLPNNDTLSGGYPCYDLEVGQQSLLVPNELSTPDRPISQCQSTKAVVVATERQYQMQKTREKETEAGQGRETSRSIYERVELKRSKNREAAARCRLRKKALYKALESQYATLEHQHSALGMRYAQLQENYDELWAGFGMAVDRPDVTTELLPEH